MPITRLEDLKISIYADGADFNSIVELNQNPLIKGFTTNPTLMKKAGIKNYKNFAIEILESIKDKTISFEVFADDLFEMEDQAREIASWGQNVNVKIPITNTKGIETTDIISNLSKSNIFCNVTAVFTLEQHKKIIDAIKNNTSAIVSIFAGRIADTGIDPAPLMKKACEISKEKTNIKLLWASPRELLNIYQAEATGCHIITVANDLLNKINLIGKNLEEFSLETVSMFYRDANKAGYKIY